VSEPRPQGPLLDAPLDEKSKTPVLDAPKRRGRALFFLGLVLYAVWELSVLGLQIYFDSPLVIQSVVRVVPGLVLFFFAWRGRLWASVLLTLAFSVTFLAGWSTALSGEFGPWVGALIGSVVSLLGLYGVALHAVPSLRAYLAFQRAND